MRDQQAWVAASDAELHRVLVLDFAAVNPDAGEELSHVERYSEVRGGNGPGDLRPVSIGQGQYRPSTEDPAQIFVDLAAQMERTAGEMKATAARVEGLLTEAQAVGARNAANAIMAEVPRAAMILLARLQRGFVILVVGGSLAMAVAASVGMAYWFRPATVICMDQDGGRFCGSWVIQPKGR